MRASLRDVAVRVHVDVPQDLINQVAAGLVDAAVMYAPPHRPGLKVDLLMEEKLVLVTTDPKGTSPPAKFVAVDWGPDFAREYSAGFPDADSPGVMANLGPLALGYVLKAGGSGYFRLRVVEPLITSGQLHLVADAPQFSYPIYVVYSSDADEPALASAISGLRIVATGKADKKTHEQKVPERRPGHKRRKIVDA
jgi:DNA-binding transcriptional LysR family regulator